MRPATDYRRGAVLEFVEGGIRPADIAAHLDVDPDCVARDVFQILLKATTVCLEGAGRFSGELELLCLKGRAPIKTSFGAAA